MKISLKQNCYYFNDPINLSPTEKSVEVDIESLSKTLLRSLQLGLATGIIEVSEDIEAYLNAQEEVPVSEQTEEAKEKVEEPVEEKQEQVAEEIKPKTTTRKRTTK